MLDSLPVITKFHIRDNMKKIAQVTNTPAPAPQPVQPARPTMMNGTQKWISNGLDKVRNFTGSPLGMGLGLGAVGAGLGYGLWKSMVSTGGSLARIPIRKMTGMSDEEYDQAMDEFAQDNRYKWLIPGAMGLALGGGYLGFKALGTQKGRGLLHWGSKTASLHKEADELWTYGGYVPDIDFSKVINSRDAKSMFTNDPQLQNDPYVRNMGLAIINDASNRAGCTNPTLGNIYDSTRDKMHSKLSLAGVTGIAANTMLANATAHLFTSAVGAVVPLSPEMRRTIIDGSTWATAVKSILT